MRKKRRKRHVTLIEIMIVILLIGLIGGALAFNMRGSMDKGKEFKTEQTMAKISDILELGVASGEIAPENISSEWRTHVSESPLIDARQIERDGWGRNYVVSLDGEGNIRVESEGLNAYRSRGQRS